MNSPGSGIPIFKIKLAETGKVRDIKKIIARIEGLPTCLSGQLVDFGDGVKGIVMGFDENDVLVLVLGDESKLRMGREVKGVNEPFTIPVGEQYLGRMINSLGEICDNGPKVETANRRPVFRTSPSITDRDPVSEFFPTGTKIVDAFIPIGKGQRQLIIGDRMTGKTVVAVDTIINQKGRDMVCIYCCIGKSMSALEKVVSTLHDAGSLEYTITMVALDNAPVGEQYIVPYAASAMADYFMDGGKDVLVVFDDVTKHAWAYRQLSLLLERPPGREAYPGDIFYIHTQLMERAGKMSTAKGGGSTTFLAIAETLEGDLTGYIPSNLISMCDGLIFMSGDMFAEGQRPAIDFTTSVSIVGGRAQPPALRAIASDLRVQHAQYVEIMRLSKLQSGLSAQAEETIRKGQALMEILQQGQGEPASLAEETLLLYAVHSSALNTRSTDAIRKFRGEIMGYVRQKNPSLPGLIAEDAELTAGLRQSMDETIEGYFAATGSGGGGTGHA